MLLIECSYRILQCSIFFQGSRITYGGSIHSRDKWSVVAVRSGREMVEANLFLVLGPGLFNFAIGGLYVLSCRYRGLVLFENPRVVSFQRFDGCTGSLQALGFARKLLIRYSELMDHVDQRALLGSASRSVGRRERFTI